MLRNAVYAGSFYDANPVILRNQIIDWLEHITDFRLPEHLIGVVVPHAGYVYSGQCAAHSYKALRQYNPDTVIIIHPSHRGNHFGYSISPYDEYATPLGTLVINTEIASYFQHNEVISSHYHQQEHSMEVQLPFLAYMNSKIRIFPIMLGNQSPKTAKILANELHNLIHSFNGKVAIIISSDLSHYHNAQVAESMDRLLIRSFFKFNEQELLNNLSSGKSEACGYGGLLVMIYLAEYYGSFLAKELCWTHSGFVSGDFNQVVGYYSAIVSKYIEPLQGES